MAHIDTRAGPAGGTDTLLAADEFGRAEWAYVRRGALAFLLGTVLPVGGFYVVYQLAGFQFAVFVVLAWATSVFAAHYWRFRTVDIFSLTTVALACLKAAAGAVSGNLTLYLLWPSFENLLYGGVFLGSALLRRPVLGMYAQRLYPIPPSVMRTDGFQRAFMGASIAWAVLSVARASLRLWLVMNLPLGTYLVVDSMIGWPVYAGLIWFTGWSALRVLRSEGLLLV